MINSLKIQNFKSIKNLQLECRRINLFIGKPNVGKSNILEAIGLFSTPYFGNNLKSGIRLEDMSNLFYDGDIGKDIVVEAGALLLRISHNGGNFTIEFKLKDDQKEFSRSYDYGGQFKGGESGPVTAWQRIKLYKFKTLEHFPRKEPAFLYPPHGNNLLTILLTHPELKSKVADLLNEFGFRLVFQPQENKIAVQKDIDDVVIQFPYSMVSDTLQRLIFYLTAVGSNNKSTLLFEEPESHFFPYYIKYLAENFALDNSNQHFLSTHNPYLLTSILEKAPLDEIAVFIVYFEGYQSKVKFLSQDQMSELVNLEANVFFNLDKFLKNKWMIYVECNPDEKLVKVLSFSRRQIIHAYGKGNICNRLRRTQNIIGLLDEDPQSAQPSYLKELELLKQSTGVKILEDKKRRNFVVMLCPRLEGWIIRASKLDKLNLEKYQLPNNSKELHIFE